MSLLCLSAAWPSSAAAAEDKKEITIGLVDTFSPDFYIHTFSPTIDHLLETLPDYQIHIVELDYRQAEAEIERLKPDFVVTSGSLYVSLMSSAGTHQIAVRQPQSSPSPSQTVASTFVVKAASPYHALKDLKGRRVAISDRRSFDGWLIAQGELAREGLDPERHFGELLETQYGMPDIATLVKIGAADAGVLSTCEYEGLLKSGLIKPNELRILAERPSDGGCRRSTDRYPDVVFSSLPWASAEAVRQTTVMLLSMSSEGLAFHWTVCSDFVPTFELLRTLSIGPFAGTNDLSLAAIWRHWKTEILLGLMLAAAVLFHIVVVNLLVRKRTAQLSEALEETERFFKEVQAARQALLSIERTNIVSQLSSMFAHEIKQPIMNISLYAGALRIILGQLTMPKDAASQTASILDAMAAEVDRSADIVEHVRSYAKKRARSPVPCDLTAVAADAVKTLQEQHLNIEVRLKSGLWVKADPFELLFIISNFLKNAAAAVESVPDGKIVLQAADLGASWQLSVEDNGPEISEEVFNRLGQAGSSGKADGLGFGLAIAAAIAEANGGHLAFRRLVPHGLCAMLVLAKAQPPADVKSSAASGDS